MVNETVDSILIKKGRIEITFLFHSNFYIAMLFLSKNHDSIHIKNIGFSSYVSLSFTEIFRMEWIT